MFSYGDLWSLRLYGSFTPPDATASAKPAQGMTTEVLERERQVLVGAPAESFLPAFARKVLAEHLRSLGIAQPKVALFHEQGKPGPALIFSMFPEDFPSEQAFGAHLQRLGWFLPRGRRVIAMRRDDAARQDLPFEDL